MRAIKTIEIIPSKSDAHRAFICAALSEEPCKVVCDETSEDIDATKACIEALMNPENDRVGADLYCKESGSTFRFLLPVVGALGKRGIFHTVGRLSKRPLSPLYEELLAHGMKISTPGSVPLIAEGQLKGGDFNISGNISSQFVSGLLFALPLLKEDSRIIVTGELQSSGYVDMTARTIERFGIKMTVAKEEGNVVCIIPGGQKYHSPGEYIVEGDWSNAGFWLAAGILGDEAIAVNGLRSDSAQGDRRIVDVVREFGGEVTTSDVPETKNVTVTAHPSKSKLKAINYDAGQTPDMIPIVALLASQAKGITQITNAGRLRSKESDRLHSITATLRSLGVDIEELEEGLIIRGSHGRPLKGGTISSFDDHRIVMMAAVASLMSDEAVSIIGWDAVNKSYPSFFDRLEDLELAGNLDRM